MKKKDFVTLIMSTVGGILFALGMCMALLPEWGAMTQGIVIGAVGAVILLAFWRPWRLHLSRDSAGHASRPPENGRQTRFRV